MKFRIIRRISYLKKAKHRRGHGIHSPFLFYLITEVIENKERLPQFKSFKLLKKKLYKKVELSEKYTQIVFHLIREFKPTSIIHYGSTLGANLAILATANLDSRVYHVNNDSVCELISRRLLNDSAIPNIQFIPENSVPEVNPEFVMLNCCNNPYLSQNIIQDSINKHSNDGVLIIRGIHESKEMETIWNEAIAGQSVRVSLDLFEIGIILFRKGLQKENFVLKV